MEQKWKNFLTLNLGLIIFAAGLKDVYKRQVQKVSENSAFPVLPRGGGVVDVAVVHLQNFV